MRAALRINKSHWEGNWGAHKVDSGVLIKIIFAWLLAIVAPYEPLLSGAFLLIFLDTLTGIWAALKRGEAIVSAELRHAGTKGLIYLTGLLAGIAAERMVPNGIAFAKSIGSLIAIAELLSILENCNTILGNRVFDLLLRKLGSRNQKP